MFARLGTLRYGMALDSASRHLLSVYIDYLSFGVKDPRFHGWMCDVWVVTRPQRRDGGPAGVVPKKRMSPLAEAYRFREHRQREQRGADPPPAATPSANALNLSVPKASPPHALEGAPPPPAAPSSPAAAAAPSPVIGKLLQQPLHDPNNNNSSGALRPTAPHRPIPTRAVSNGCYSAPATPSPLPPAGPLAPPSPAAALPEAAAASATVKRELVVDDSPGAAPAGAGAGTGTTPEVTGDEDNNNKLHSCEACGKRFSRRQLLVQHRRVHTGERPYTCGACGKQFSQRGHWSTHQKLHEPARAAEHACEACGKAFVTRASLKQ
ncbi:Zinc finger protein 189 [Frankliniella fusca]|uniref:Zinc finger protein 189 n=1 Tax=Frankliniella fusca TaxID=407009 RepID=A0AAE1LEX5_9NEOP|nr:Zinc finger protein 189 [Frankliniella fusca]